MSWFLKGIMRIDELTRCGATLSRLRIDFKNLLGMDKLGSNLDPPQRCFKGRTVGSYKGRGQSGTEERITILRELGPPPELDYPSTVPLLLLLLYSLVRSVSLSVTAELDPFQFCVLVPHHVPVTWRRTHVGFHGTTNN